MFFKIIFTLFPFDLGDQPSIKLKVPYNESIVDVEFHKITKADLKPSQSDGDIECSAVFEKQVSVKQIEVFRSLSPGQLPEKISQTVSETQQELVNAIRKAVRVFMWKRGIFGSHRIIRFGSGDILYSEDGKNWKSCQGKIYLSISYGDPIPKSSEIEETNELLGKSFSQPLGHELLSEAQSLKDSSRRSSLVIGIAAAEIGFKECTNKLMPQAAWLIANIQSPPLKKMLLEFLPSFPAKELIDGKVVSPPLGIIKTLDDGIFMRNATVHGKPLEINPDKLEDILKSVRDLLYLLDYYCGHKWALKRIRADTLNELRAETSKK